MTDSPKTVYKLYYCIYRYIKSPSQTADSLLSVGRATLHGGDQVTSISRPKIPRSLNKQVSLSVYGTPSSSSIDNLLPQMMASSKARSGYCLNPAWAYS